MMPAKPRCDGCPNYDPDSGVDGTCHAKGPPWKPVKAHDFCPGHPEWDGYLVQIGAAPDDGEDPMLDEAMLR